jgi:hypothetical protein
MAKHKTVTHLPAAPPAAARLSAQLFTAAGELIMVGVAVVGIVTVVGWVIAGAELRRDLKPREHLPAPREIILHCWFDRRYGEICEPPYRPLRRVFD